MDDEDAGDVRERRRKRIEYALIKSEERFRSVVEAAPSAMVMVGADGRIEMVNAQTERLFGYDRSQMLGRPVEMMVPERFRDQHPERRSSFLADPRSRPMGAGRDLYAMRRDGSEFPVEIGLNPIETEEGTKVLSVIVDISARRRQEERFRTVVEAAPNAMVMVNADGRIEMVNAQAEAMFGYARGEMLDQPVEMLVPQRFRRHHPALRASFGAAPVSRPMGAGRDLYGLRKDGSEFPVEIGLNPIETEDGKMVLSAIVDISDRKLKEERINSALREKDLLLAEIHHRVKNNLQVVHSLLDLQSSQISDRSVREMLRECQNRVQSMALIHQTLYQSKSFAEVDFRHFLEGLIPTLLATYTIDPDRVRLEVAATDVHLPINIAVPCGLVVNELISNALKHAFPSGRSGCVTTELGLAGPNVVRLSVTDTGVGIPPEVQLEQGATLGLQLVLLLVDQLRGKLAVNRADPTRFEIHFPFRA